MIIAAHILQNEHSSTPFLSEYLPLLATKNPNDHFIIFTDKIHDPDASLITNITQVLITPKIKNSLLLHYWYNFKLPYLLKKYNASVFITENGIASIRTVVPQLMVIKDLSVIKKNSLVKNKYARYLKKYFSQFLKKAFAVIATENYLKELLIKKNSLSADKIKIIYPGINENYKALSWQQKEAITTTYTSEKDFFIFPVSAATKDNITPVLKAFSQFKKWHKSNMQIVLLLQNIPAESLVKDLHLYRFKNDVKIISVTDDTIIVKIISAAYALIYLPAKEDIEYTILNAMQAGVPVIALENDLNKTRFSDAVLYCSDNQKSIAEKMILIYKDEYIRNDQIKKGILQTAVYNSKKAETELWQAIIEGLEA